MVLEEPREVGLPCGVPLASGRSPHLVEAVARRAVTLEECRPVGNRHRGGLR